MRLPQRKNRERLAINMTPMIDVVFLLIIFFLVSSHLAKQETQMEMDLPAASSGHTPEENEQPRVIVNVLPNGRMFLGSGEVSEASLDRRMKQAVATEGRDLEIRIRADRRVIYGHVEPILLACAKAGLWNVTFTVVRGK